MDLKIKFVPYEKFKKKGFRPILRDLKEKTIILIDAKLDPEEEAKLIAEIMKRVSDDFSGIELSSIDLESIEKNPSFFDKFKNNLIEMITGKKRGVTIIGSAKIIRRIQKEPEDLLVYM
ncbi:MAG: hypothetical protein DRP15_01275 [Candidatus Aenigmatarchaeota archaeon]|nr:MAG: hypothetical protein DRP15_01275 [Candidatus Aenigmarchaeota archaeon]